MDWQRYLERLAVEEGQSLTKIAVRIGLDPSTLYRLRQEQGRVPSAKTLEALIRAFPHRAEEIVRLMSEDGGPQSQQKMNLLEKKVRLFVYEKFREASRPPVLEEIMAEFGLRRNEGYEVLKSLEAQRGLGLLQGTQRILMAWPFSAVVTPFRVKVNGKEYFANCAWDAVALHVMLEQAVEIHSYCHQSGEPVTARISASGEVDARPPQTLVYIALPASRWWEDIVNTCSNNMVFFASPARMEEWLAENGGSQSGAALSIEQTIQLSQPFYANWMSLDYERPPAAQIREHFAQMGLTGSFWEI